METQFRPTKIERGNSLWTVTKITDQTSDLKEWSTFGIILIEFPQNVQFSDQETLLCVFDDDEAVIKMTIKERSPTMRHVSRTHSVVLDSLVILSDQLGHENPDQTHRHQKNPHTDVLTIRNFTRYEWNHLLCSFTIEPFQFYSFFWSNGKKISTMFKRRMSEIKIGTNDESYCKGSLELVILNFRKHHGKRSYGNQNPWSAKAERARLQRSNPLWAATQERSLTVVTEQYYWKLFSARNSKWDGTKIWSSQEWKADRNRWVIERCNPL